MKFFFNTEVKIASSNVGTTRLQTLYLKIKKNKHFVIKFKIIHIPKKYSVCSLVVPRLEEAILTPVLKKNFKRPLILGQEGHNYPPKHSNLSYDQFGVRLEQSDTAPPLLPPGWRDTDSFSWICSVFNSSISRRS